MLRYIVRMIAVRIRFWFGPRIQRTVDTGWYESKDFLNQVKDFEDEGRAGKLYDKGDSPI